MPLTFPSSPALNDTYTYGSKTWKWDGTKWNIQIDYSNSPTGPTGAASQIARKSLYISPSLTNGQGSYSVSIPTNTYLLTKNDSFSQASGDTYAKGGRPSLISLTNYSNFKNVDVLTTTTTNSSISVNSMNPFSRISSVSTGVLGVAIVYANSLYVVAGYNSTNGTMVTSTDAITWTSRTSGFGTSNIYALTYANNIYIAGGVGSTLTTSTDAITWTTRTTGFGTNAIRAFAYGNGVFVAVGDGGTLATSTDGISWTMRTSGTTNQIKDVIFANSIFIFGTANGVIKTSTDGITWTDRSSQIWGTTDVNQIAYGNGKYIIAGGWGHMATSTDTITWTISDTSNIPNFWNGYNASYLKYINGYFLYNNSYTNTFISADGDNWLLATDLVACSAAVYANGSLFIQSNGGSITKFNTTGSLSNSLSLYPISAGSVINAI